VLVDLDRGVLLLDRREVGVRADRRRRRDDPDPSRPRGEGGRDGARSDDAEDRDVVPPAELRKGDRGRRVAGDDDRLHLALGERIEGLATERADLVIGPDAIRGPGVVAEVDGRFGR
jgi:hypothetical protein